ncbi:MAG: GtrA family protein [Micrococcales bacterium]|nr:GtrA family protein [Micrococcales bacterium]
MRRFLAQFTRFGLVGLVGLVVDVALFNLLLNTVFAPERVDGGPLLAKAVSTSAAIVCNWIGNRLWTFREHRGRQLWREGLEFALVSVGGLLIGLACLWLSHYVLGFTGRLADNIASNVVGLGLGTAFRFLLYRYWVFRPRRGEPHVFDPSVTTAPRGATPVVPPRGPAALPIPPE